MNFGVLVYSKTGTTFKFAGIIADRLKARGHSVEVTRLVTEPADVSGTVRGHKPFRFTNLPDVSGYDVVLLGGPVWAFSVNPVTFEAVKGLDLKGKKFMPFVTHGLPFSFMGANQALGLLGKTAKEKGAEVLDGKEVAAKKKEEGMIEAADEIAAMF